jgi:hypothetical protein
VFNLRLVLEIPDDSYIHPRSISKPYAIGKRARYGRGRHMLREQIYEAKGQITGPKVIDAQQFKMKYSSRIEGIL